MPVTTESVAPGASPAPERATGKPRPLGRRLFADRFAARFVTLSGMAIIAAILAILFVIVAVVWPLFVPPSARKVPAGSLPAGTVPLALAVDEYREEAFVATEAGLVGLSVGGGKVFSGFRTGGSTPWRSRRRSRTRTECGE